MKYATSNDVAAFIAEPVMGEGGIIVPPANYFKEVKKVLDHYGILFIADEVQCGFARTGKDVCDRLLRSDAGHYRDGERDRGRIPA